MTLAALLTSLRGRGVGLIVEDGRLRYLGPRLAADDPIRVTIVEHRAQVVDLFTFKPVGWSDRLGGRVYELVLDRPGCWRETLASAALCVWCPAPVADGDHIACPEHRRQLDAQTMPWDVQVAREVAA